MEILKGSSYTFTIILTMVRETVFEEIQCQQTMYARGNTTFFECLTEASLIFDQQTHVDIIVPCKHEYNVLVEEGIL